MTANSTQTIPAGYVEPNDEKLEKQFREFVDIQLIKAQEVVSSWRDSFVIATVVAFIFGIAVFTYAYLTGNFTPAPGESVSLFTALLVLSIAMICIGIPAALVLNKKSSVMLEEIGRRSRVRVSKFCPTVKPAAPVFSIYEKVALPEDIYIDDSDEALMDIVDSIYEQDEEFDRIVDAMLNDENAINYDSLSQEEKSVVNKVQASEELTDEEKELYLSLMDKMFEEGIIGVINRIREANDTDDDAFVEIDNDGDDTIFTEEIKNEEDELDKECVSVVTQSTNSRHRTRSPRHARKIYTTCHSRWRKYSKIPHRVNKTKVLHKQIKRRRK